MFSNLSEYEAKCKEKELIKKYKSKECKYGYNCTFGGDGVVGFIRSQDAIQGTIDGNSKTVYQYSTDGVFIKEWKNAITIERELGFKSTDVGSCCLGKRKQAYGYIWRYEYIKKINPIKIGVDCTPIYQYSLEGKYIKSWKSGKQIEQELGFYSTNIYLCCKGGQNTAYGYLWSYDKKDYINRTEQTTFNQYTLDGNYIQTFFSEKEASIALGYKRLPIHEVCRGERGQAGGFMWRYEKKDKIEPYVKNKKIAPNKKKVYQFELDGTFVAEWESLLEAAKSIGVNSTSALTRCIQGKRKSAYGYVWKDNVE